MSCQGNKSSFTNRQRPTLSTARFFHHSTDRTAAALRKPQKQKLENKFPQCLYLELCLTFLISTANFLRAILQLSTQQLATIHCCYFFISQPLQNNNIGSWEHSLQHTTINIRLERHPLITCYGCYLGTRWRFRVLAALTRGREYVVQFLL